MSIRAQVLQICSQLSSCMCGYEEGKLEFKNIQKILKYACERLQYDENNNSLSRTCDLGERIFLFL